MRGLQRPALAHDAAAGAGWLRRLLRRGGGGGSGGSSGAGAGAVALARAWAAAIGAGWLRRRLRRGGGRRLRPDARAATQAPAMVCGGDMVGGEEAGHYFQKKYLGFFN
jgi:hypothetical protein